MKKNKKILIFIIFLVLIVGASIYYWEYGFTYPPCNEHEKEVQVPEEFRNVAFRFTQPMVIHDTRTLYCSPLSRQYPALDLKSYADLLNDANNTRPLNYNGNFTVTDAFTYEVKGSRSIPAETHFILKNQQGEYYISTDDKFINLLTGQSYIQILKK